MSHDQILRKRAGVTLETAVRRILRVLESATAADIESGATWYAEAGSLADDLAGGDVTREHAACVIAALSPRTTWARNVAGAVDMVRHNVARPAGQIGTNVDRAARVLKSGNPLDVLTGPKTNRFARNIIGDTEAVTVDVWAARVVGVTELELARVGVYDALEHAYRLAARRAGLSPSTVQATTWIVARNGRAK